MTVNPDDRLPQYLLFIKNEKIFIKKSCHVPMAGFFYQIKAQTKTMYLKPCTKASSYLGDTMSSGITHSSNCSAVISSSSTATCFKVLLSL